MTHPLLAFDARKNSIDTAPAPASVGLSRAPIDFHEPSGTGPVVVFVSKIVELEERVLIPARMGAPKAIASPGTA